MKLKMKPTRAIAEFFALLGLAFAAVLFATLLLVEDLVARITRRDDLPNE